MSRRLRDWQHLKLSKPKKSRGRERPLSVPSSPRNKKRESLKLPLGANKISLRRRLLIKKPSSSPTIPTERSKPDRKNSSRLTPSPRPLSRRLRRRRKSFLTSKMPSLRDSKLLLKPRKKQIASLKQPRLPPSRKKTRTDRITRSLSKMKLLRSKSTTPRLTRS